jgi:hypothetical protein
LSFADVVSRRHVHSDLSSYTCLAENCDETFFEFRKKWWAHEMESHRKKWTCGICKANLASMATMKSHIWEAHADQVHVDQINDVACRFGRPVTYFHASDCPLCDYPALLRQRGLSEEEIARIPVDKFGRHLGRHLEQLALFVLPSTDLATEDDMSDEEREGKSDSGDSDSECRQHEALPEPELMQKLAEIICLQQNKDPERLAGSPDLAMRWQPPQDFTPPLEDFDAEDAEGLPVRQEPIYGGDLHTPGWARGTGSRKEGFCARCPVSHWTMDLLLSHGANINTTSKHGWTPLMLASKRGDEGCVRWLIDRGADVNHLSPDRWTALAEPTISGFTLASHALSRTAPCFPLT